MLISDQFPFLDVSVTIGTWSFSEQAYLDTGFEGGLLIPEYLKFEIIASATRLRYRVAHDRILWAPTWTGIVEIEENRYSAEVAAMGSRFLLGRQVLDRMIVTFDRGREVRIEF